MLEEGPAPHEIIARWIHQRRRRPGPAEAWVLPFGIPVWILIALLQLEEGDVERVAGDHRMPLEAMHAAVAFYLRHQEAIDEQIELHRTYHALARPRPSQANRSTIK